MNRLCTLVICLLFATALAADDVRLFYQKNQAVPRSIEEKRFVEHVINSFEKGMKLESKLSGGHFEEVDASKKWRAKTIPHYHSLADITNYPGYHILNNLCSYPNASHLHVGLLGGDSMISSLYQNQSILDQKIGVDWFQECPLDIFSANCNRFLDASDYTIINSGCLDVDKSLIKQPINIYFYDADHSLKGHERAITYYHDVFDDLFVIVIDDWSCPWIRAATFNAFDKLKYTVLYENAAMNLSNTDHGQYVGVIRKSPELFKEQRETVDSAVDWDLYLLKHKISNKLANSWCSQSKSSLIIDLIYQAKPETIVEIGVFEGTSFLPIVSTVRLNGQGHAYAIDAWSNEEAIKGLPVLNPHYAWWSRVSMIDAYVKFQNLMIENDLNDWYTVLPYASELVASEFDRIDFLHLSGNFSEQGSFKDLELYFPKVPSGGYILLSNAFFYLNNQMTKIKSLEFLLEHCEVVMDVDGSQTILFRKN